MNDQLFDVVFFGILQSGKDRETVMQNMASLFKTTPEKLLPYFAGGRKVIKGKLNANAAEKYKTALENVGLVIKIEACATTEQASSQPAAQKNTPAEAATSNPGIATDKLSIAPVGADVIEHPAEKPVQKIDDISDITMAEAGADVIEHPVKPVAQKINDISDITMAEVGSDVLEHPQEVIAPPINDISGITLAQPGADLVENPKAVEKVDIPDTSELTLDD